MRMPMCFKDDFEAITDTTTLKICVQVAQGIRKNMTLGEVVVKHLTKEKGQVVLRWR